MTAANLALPRRFVGTVACVVCGLRADVLLCRECAEQPAATRARVRAWLNANIAQGRAALEQWDAVREPRQAAWDAIQAAREQSDYAARCAKHRTAGNVYGHLLDAQATYERQVAALEAERVRLEKALGVIDESLH